MSLGETIYTLRTRRNLSQGDLAEQLDVSRQSISKWETDRSVPELDKLVKMSRLFGVSLDELVLGAEKGPAEERGENPASQPLPPGGLRTRKVISIVLFVLAALMVLLLTIIGSWSGLLIGLMFTSPFLACGILCLVTRKHTGLWCAWTVYFLVEEYFRYASGISWTLTLMTPYFEPSMNTIRLAVAWVELLVLAALIVVTVIRFHKVPLDWTGPNRRRMIGGFVLYAALHLPIPMPVAVQWYILSWVKIILLTVLLTNIIRILYTARQSKT